MSGVDRKAALDMYGKSIVEKFLVLRRRLGLSQRAAAEKWNLAAGTINNWETYKSDPSAAMLMHITKAANVPWEYWESGEMNRSNKSIYNDDLLKSNKELVEALSRNRELQSQLNAAVRGRAEAELRAAALEEALNDSRKSGKKTA